MVLCKGRTLVALAFCLFFFCVPACRNNSPRKTSREASQEKRDANWAGLLAGGTLLTDWETVLSFSDELWGPFFCLWGDRCFVFTRDLEILVYSLKQKKKVDTWGRRGQGPGEHPYGVKDVRPVGNSWMILCMDKIILRDSNGHHMGTVDVPWGMDWPKPFAQGFIGLDYSRITSADQRKLRPLEEVLIAWEGSGLDGKNLFALPFRPPSRLVKGRQGFALTLPSSPPQVEIWKDRAYVSSPLEGFVVHVLDEHLRRVETIRLPWQPRPVPEAVKEAFGQEVSSQDYRRNFKGGVWFYETYPAFDRFSVVDDALWFQLFPEAGRVRLVSTSLKGEPRGSWLIPCEDAIRPSHEWWVQDGKVYTIVDHDDRDWELRACTLPGYVTR